MSVGLHIHDWATKPSKVEPDADERYEIRTYPCNRTGCIETQVTRTKKEKK